MCRRIFIAVACGSTIGLGCTSGDSDSEPTEEAPLQAWLEFTDVGEVPKHLRAAAHFRLDIRLAVQAGVHDQVFIETACTAAASHDLGLTLWPLLAEEDGYWPNQSNAEAFSTWALEVLDWTTDSCDALQAVVVDMNMPTDRSDIWMGDEIGSTADRVALLEKGMDEPAFLAAKDVYKAWIEAVRSRHPTIEVHLSTLPMLVDDHLDGDESIAMALWTPVEGLDWDRVSFQVYRTVFPAYSASLLGTEAVFGPGLVSSYAADIVELYGDRAAIDIGIIGPDKWGPGGMTEPGGLQEDIAAALDAGIPLNAIHIDSLDGLVDQDDPHAWVSIPAPSAASDEAAVDSIRDWIKGLDGMW